MSERRIDMRVREIGETDAPKLPMRQTTVGNTRDWLYYVVQSSEDLLGAVADVTWVGRPGDVLDAKRIKRASGMLAKLALDTSRGTGYIIEYCSAEVAIRRWPGAAGPNCQ